MFSKNAHPTLSTLRQKSWWVFAFCTFFWMSLPGQIPSFDDDQGYQLAQEAMIAISNDHDLLPLGQLDTAQITVMATPGADRPLFIQTLREYSPIQTMTPTQMTEALANAPSKNSLPFNLVIYQIYPEKQTAQEVAELLNLVNRLSCPRIGVIFGEGFVPEGIQVSDWSAIYPSGSLLKGIDSDWSASIAAQAIMGAHHILPPEDLSDHKPFLKSARPQPILNNGRLGFGAPTAQQLDYPQMADSIQAIVEEGIREQAYPGAQVVVAHKGKIIYHQTFGFHTYDSLRAVHPKDLYDYASVTKITSALPAVMRLYGQKQFDLDATLEAYFPYFKGSNKSHLTIRQMLAHHARLRPWVPYWKGAIKGNATYPWKKRWSEEKINRGQFKARTLKKDSSEQYSIKLTDELWLHQDFKKRRIYKSIKKSPLNEKPGYVYSGLLFYLLPDLVARLTGTDFETHLKQEIYHKIGAYTITYNPMRFYEKSRMAPTEKDTFFRLQQLQGVVHDEGAAMMAGVSGNAGLFSTAVDLTKLMQLYLNNGFYGGEQIIAQEAIEEFTQCQFCDEGNRRGLGFDKPLIEYNARLSSVAQAASMDSYGHSGYTGTFAWVDPAEELVFVFFSNRVYPTRDNRKLYSMNIRPRIHSAIYGAINH